MTTRQEIAETIRKRFAGARDRGRVLAQALMVRAEIAATRRRQRAVFAELGEVMYGKMASSKTLGNDGDLLPYKVRIEGLEAEVQQRETSLREIIQAGAQENEPNGKVPEAGTDDETKSAKRGKTDEAR